MGGAYALVHRLSVDHARGPPPCTAACEIWLSPRAASATRSAGFAGIVRAQSEVINLPRITVATGIGPHIGVQDAQRRCAVTAGAGAVKGDRQPRRPIAPRLRVAVIVCLAALLEARHAIEAEGTHRLATDVVLTGKCSPCVAVPLPRQNHRDRALRINPPQGIVRGCPTDC